MLSQRGADSRLRVIGVDPGRSSMLTGAEKKVGADGAEDEITRHVLTREAYYRSIGTAKKTRLSTSWLAGLKTVHDDLAANSLRSTSMVSFRAHLEVRNANHAALWEEKLKRRWGQAVFRTRCLKQKALRRFVVGMWAKSRAGRRAAPMPVIAYGNAHFAATGWGERPVPVKGVRRIVLATYPHVLTDEYNTSKMCCVCGEVLQVVKCLKVDRRGRLKVREIRGLRRCGSYQCRSTSFKNRDVNAALNMLSIFRGGNFTSTAQQRPQPLRRGENHGDPDTFRLRPVDRVFRPSDRI